MIPHSRPTGYRSSAEKQASATVPLTTRTSPVTIIASASGRHRTSARLRSRSRSNLADARLERYHASFACTIAMPGAPCPYWLPGAFASARGGAGLLHPQLLQYEPQRARPGKAELKQIGADESGEPQPVTAMKNRARLHAQGERHQD